MKYKEKQTEKNPLNKTELLNIKVTPNQKQILTELASALSTDERKVTISVIVRTIINDFLNRNEETLENIILKNVSNS